MAYRYQARPEPIVRCAFTGKSDLISNMVKSQLRYDDNTPIYFSSQNALSMYKHLHGYSPIIKADNATANSYYIETLRTCYPGIYKKQFGN